LQFSGEHEKVFQDLQRGRDSENLLQTLTPETAERWRELAGEDLKFAVRAFQITTPLHPHQPAE